MPPDFVSLVFHVYFSHGLLVYLSTCISGGYHVIFEPKFSSDVYSMWAFSRGSHGRTTFQSKWLSEHLFLQNFAGGACRPTPPPPPPLEQACITAAPLLLCFRRTWIIVVRLHIHAITLDYTTRLSDNDLFVS